MAEFLIRVIDKSNPDPALDAMLHKQGDVLTVQEDGWPWSEAELTNPDWRILKIPGADPRGFADMLVPIVDATGVINRRRSRGFVLTPIAALIAAGQVITLTGAQRAAVLNARQTRNPFGPIARK